MTEDGTTRVSRDSAVLGLGSMVNGLGAYAVVVIGVRSIGADAFAPVALLWSFWAFSGAALAFPIQHWVIRQMTIDGGAHGVSAALPRLVRLVSLIALAQGVVAFVLRERLFGSSSLFWPIAVMVLAYGTAGLGLARGALSGSGRFSAAASVIAGENVVRVVAAVLAALAWNTSHGFGVALLVGPLAALMWRLPLRWRGGGSVAVSPSVRLVAASSGGLVLSQIILQGGPVALALLAADPAEVTVLFSTLALFRAPYLVALGLTLRSTGAMTRWVVDQGQRKLARVGGRVVAAAGVTAALGYLAAGAIGPSLVSIVFGSEARPSAVIAGLVAAGSVVALAGLWLIIALVAARREAALVMAWILGVAAFGAVVLLGIDPPALRVALAFLVGQGTAVVMMTIALVWWSTRTAPPASGERAAESP